MQLGNFLGFTIICVALSIVSCKHGGKIGRVLNPDPKRVKDPTEDPRTRTLSKPEVKTPKEMMDRAGSKEEVVFWPDGVVYYTIHSTLPAETESVLNEAIADLQTYTCIKFEPKTAATKNYVEFYQGTAGQCDSNQGMTGGYQNTSLGEGCGHKGTILHELLHILGFQHEHNRCDRDQYVKVNWTNIYNGAEINFQKQSCDLVPTGGADYDYSSIMHYSGLSWATDKNYNTIIASDDEAQDVMGQRDGLSEFDVEKVNIVYGCRTIEPVLTTVEAALDIDATTAAAVIPVAAVNTPAAPPAFGRGQPPHMQGGYPLMQGGYRPVPGGPPPQGSGPGQRPPPRPLGL